MLPLAVCVVAVVPPPTSRGIPVGVVTGRPLARPIAATATSSSRARARNPAVPSLGGGALRAAASGWCLLGHPPGRALHAGPRLRLLARSQPGLLKLLRSNRLLLLHPRRTSSRRHRRSSLLLRRPAATPASHGLEWGDASGAPRPTSGKPRQRAARTNPSFTRRSTRAIKTFTIRAIERPSAGFVDRGSGFRVSLGLIPI